MAGTLFLIGTPLGNLSDLSPRAIETLRSVDVILCEDTRHTGKLLAAFDIRTPTWSFHEHNQDQKLEEVIGRLSGGDSFALASDAGMPVLSDPGFPLVRRAREAGVPVVPIPGPFAAALALVSSGIPAVPFTFWGFVPSRSGERGRFWETVRASGMTAVVYESPNRIIESLRDAARVLGDVQATAAREMTKMHEEFIHGTPASIADELEARGIIRGEFTVVLAAAAEAREEPPDDEALRRELDALRSSGMKSSEAVRMIAERYGLDRRELYARLTG